MKRKVSDGKFPAMRFFCAILLLLILGCVASDWLNGHPDFCNGFNPCDQQGDVIPWGLYLKRQLMGTGVIVAASIFSTLMMGKEFYRVQKQQELSAKTNSENV